MPLIPHFTLGITYPTHEHLLLLVIRKAMYASYSTLYSRHASCTQRVLLLVLLKANVCLLFQTLLSAFYTSSMHGHLLLVIFKTMYICLLFKALLHALRTLLVLLLAILRAVYVSYSWLYTLGIKYPTHRHLLPLVILEAMYASYSTLYSRHPVSNASCCWCCSRQTYVSYSRLNSLHYAPIA